MDQNSPSDGGGGDGGDEFQYVRLKRGAEADIPLPHCPYTDDDKIEDGVACYIPGCTCTFTSWGSGLNHLRNFHGAKMIWLSGTHIHNQGKLDLQKDQQKRRQERPEQKESNKKANINEKKPHEQQLQLVKDYGFPARGDALQMVAPPKHADTTRQTLVSAAGSSRDHLLGHRPEAAMQMVAEMYQGYKAKADEESIAKQWKELLPSVAIKDAYIQRAAPIAKREQGCGRASWPKELKKDIVDIPELKCYMDEMNTGAAQQKVILKGAGRALGALHISDTTPPTDVKVLVGFCLNEVYTQLIDLPILHPKYFWTSDLLEGLGTYINFWIWKLKKMMVRGEPGPLNKYRDCLELLLGSLKSGHMSKCNAFKEESFKAKGKDDLYVLKNFPSIQEMVQPAVANAMLVMKKIGEEYIGKANMPPNTLALANIIVCGVWECDTFLGRKYEIEHCLATDMQKTLEDGLEYLPCKYHKTAPTYGDVVKFLTPGLLNTLETYDKLPKPPCQYFLVPLTQSAETISFPTNLKAFYNKFMKKAKVWPTCNQWRKKFHNELMKLTKDETALKDLMRQIGKRYKIGTRLTTVSIPPTPPPPHP